MKLLQDSGVDRVICLRFDQELAETKADEFIERCLVERLGVRHLVVGEDFRFGRGRSGSVELLRELALAHGFGLTGVSSVRIDGERVTVLEFENCSEMEISIGLASSWAGDSLLVGMWLTEINEGERGDFRQRISIHAMIMSLCGEFLLFSLRGSEIGRLMALPILAIDRRFRETSSC